MQEQPQHTENQQTLERISTHWKTLGQLFVAILIGLVVGNTISSVIFLQAGIDPSQFQAAGDAMPRYTRDILRLTTLFNHLCTFAIPVLVLAWIQYRESWQDRLYLVKRPNLSLLLLSFLFLLISFPLAQYLYWWNLKLPLPAELLEMERAAEALVEAFLVMDDPIELALNLLTVGLVAAFGEELVFRGMVQPHLSRIVRNEHLGLWLTALLFSAIHFQFAGFLPRMLLGAVLGYLFLWSRNLWVPILAHFLFNGMQIVAKYMLGDKMDQFDPEQMDKPHWLVGILPLLLLIGLGREIQKRQQRNRSWH